MVPRAPLQAARQPTAKICFVGEERVGKTSTILRFARGVYTSDYIRTVGTLVTKASVFLPAEEGVPVTMNLIVWDIMGRQTFMDLLGEAYFAGVRGVFGVVDRTRASTMERLEGWLKSVRAVAGEVPITILANKSDLVGSLEVSDEQFREFCLKQDAPGFCTSAKTGGAVEAAFLEMAAKIRRAQHALEGVARYAA